MSSSASLMTAPGAELAHIAPVTLEGTHACLEPLLDGHAGALMRAGEADEIWTWLPSHPTTLEDFERWVDDALAAQEAGHQLPFVIVDRATRDAVGSTCFLNISPPDRRLEIGATWLAPVAQRTAINTECKYLLLRHAFEVLGCLRVELKTDARNTNSQRAI